MRLSGVRSIVFKWPKQGQPMVVPVTYMGKLSQMPVRWMFKTGWMFRYLIYSNIICFPLWFWIQSKVNSPEAVAAWEAKKKSDHDKEHIQHMWADIQGYNANK